MIKTVGLLQRREGLDPAGFCDHYENNHAPLAVRLLGFPGYQRNYPRSDAARAALGFDGFSEFWFRDEDETAKIGAIMATDVGAQLLEDEPRFMNVPGNQTYAVSERLYGTRPEPGKTLRALAVTRVPYGMAPGPAERDLHLEDRRVRERALPGVIAALHIVPEAASMPVPSGVPEPGCIESLWLVDDAALTACNQWRAEAGAPLLFAVDEAGTPVLP